MESLAKPIILLFMSLSRTVKLPKPIFLLLLGVFGTTLLSYSVVYLAAERQTTIGCSSYFSGSTSLILSYDLVDFQTTIGCSNSSSVVTSSTMLSLHKVASSRAMWSMGLQTYFSLLQSKQYLVVMHSFLRWFIKSLRLYSFGLALNACRGGPPSRYLSWSNKDLHECSSL